jgi:hypothetical protein
MSYRRDFMPTGGSIKRTGVTAGASQGSGGSLFKALRRIALGGEEPPTVGLNGGPPKSAVKTLPSTQAATAHAGPDNADRHNFAFMERYLHTGDAVLDIGTNAGAYAIAAAKVVGLAGRVDAVEPSPTMRARLLEAVTAAAPRRAWSQSSHGRRQGWPAARDGTTNPAPPLARRGRAGHPRRGHRERAVGRAAVEAALCPARHGHRRLRTDRASGCPSISPNAIRP